ncbi:MAG: hypothetical protein QXU52_00740 [Fervidicoccaceae archaeon]
MGRVKLIAVAAHSEDADPSLARAAELFVETLASSCGERAALVLGGYWGLMRVVVDKALSLGLRVVLLPPIEMERGREYPPDALVIRTGLSFRGRSVALARSCDVMVALGGASGTMIEVLLAYTEGKPSFVLQGTGLPTDKLERLAPFPDGRRLARIELIEDPVALAERVCSELERGLTEQYSQASRS